MTFYGRIRIRNRIQIREKGPDPTGSATLDTGLKYLIVLFCLCSGFTPVHYAAYHGQEAALELLLQTPVRIQDPVI